MLRILLVLATTLLLHLSSSGLAPFPGLGETGLVEIARTDCCPGEPDEGVDCCDVDFGMCCAGVGAALLCDRADTLHVGYTLLVRATPLSPRLLLTRATGPPPTPPPIG